jgi:hypothetical protein
MTQFFKYVSILIATISLFFVAACTKQFDSPPAPSDPNIVANTTIKDFKALHKVSGDYDVITTDIIISGIVVANDKSGNFYKQLYIQDNTGSLQILLDANSLYASYPVGRKIFIKCKGLCLSDYFLTMQLGIKAIVGGLPSVEGIPSNLISNYIAAGSINNPVTPVVVTLADLTSTVTMQDKYLGALIKLENYEFTDTSSTYSDTSSYKATSNSNIKTCDGSTVIVRTSAYADFAGQKVAKGNGSITAIYTAYKTTKQLIIRDLEDIKFNQPRCSIFEEGFEGIGANNLPLTVSGWKNIGEVGNVLYQNAVFGPVKCAKITAFRTGASVVSSWLISPAINLTGVAAPKLSFTTAAGFAVGATSFKVYISTNYAGGNTPSTSTWTEIPFTLATGLVSGYSQFLSSGVISLSAYANKTIYLGFKYDGGDPDKTTTFELDDVKILR